MSDEPWGFRGRTGAALPSGASGVEHLFDIVDPATQGPLVAGALHSLLADPRIVEGDLTHIRAIASAFPLIVGVLDAELRYQACFGGGLRRFDVAEAELLGVGIELLGERASAVASRALAGETVRFDSQGRFRDRPWALQNLVAPRPGGAGAVVVSVDVTEQVTAERALAESEDRFRRLADAAPVGIFLIDDEGEVVYANSEAEQQTGRSVGEMLGREWEVTLHGDDLERVLAAAAAFAEHDAEFDLTFRVVRSDGEVRWVHGRAEKLRAPDQRAIGTVAVSEDITERREALDALREREERTRAILENAAQGIVTCTVEGELLEFNAAAERIFGLDSDGAIGTSIGRCFTADSAAALASRRAMLRAALEGGDAVSGAIDELEGRRSDGRVVHVEVSSTVLQSGGRTLVTHLIRDLSERRDLEERLRYQSTHDEITGLANRALLTAQLSSGLTRASYNRIDLAVLYVSLCRLDVVTDSLGHAAADELVFQAAERLRIVCEPTDLVSRFAPDAFVVLVEGIRDVTEAVTRATSIIEVLAEPFGLTEDEGYVVPQVGLAYAPSGRGATTQSLVGDAALAAQRASERGGPGFELFDRGMRARVDERRRTENALRRGVERDEMELHYQPVVSLGSGEVRGFEALVRWNRPGVGRVAPGEFIPIAEESGLILPLGNWILREACMQLGRWQQEWPERRLNLSVNLSARQLTQFDLPERLAEHIAQGGFDPNRLILELTETVLLRDVDAAARTLSAVKALGVRIAMDDFGTGYSSLTYLRQFPIDIVKIDRSFVGALDTDSRDSSIVDMVITLARSLGLAVVAEGVETEQQRQALVALGCAYAQGFHFSPAEPAASVPELLAILRP